MCLRFDISDIEPLVEAIVAKTLAAAEKLPGDRLAFPEAEAAQLLGIAKHQLRDARLRGEIRAERIGKSVIYARSELLSLLNSE